MERFMELYQTVYREMYRLAYYYLGNSQDAEDAVQDAALAAYENFRKLRNEEAFRPWIFRILVNCCKSRLRRNQKRTEPLDGTDPGYEPSLSSKTELEELLSRLPDEDRMIVVLSVFGGYKGEEIARILGKKHSTIRSRYRRALKKLEQDIKPGKEMQG